MSYERDAEPREDIINHSPASAYVPPQEPELAERLEWFRDQKLALMVHWGGYSQLGLCESWPLSDGDASWSRTGIDWETNPDAFRRQYFDLNKTFNPLRFEPDKWADFAKQAGFKYLIFTTKHHDGFCMFDTKQTGYKITGEDCPFHTHRYADIARHLFNAFRERGMAIAAYFSKPDWHCPWYWAPDMERPVAFDRNPTYDIQAYPELWNEFVRFTHAQIMELARDYGRIDILWLDGGQVRSQNGQDILLGEVIKRARELQPWLLTSDRTVGGLYENYITPEQQIPGEVLGVPWESNLTIGTSFSYAFEDEYKSARTLLHLFLEVVAKGGNLALNIGAQPDGRLPRRAMEPALEMGAWLYENGEAIYATRTCKPYLSGPWVFTKSKAARYAIYLCQEGEKLPGKLIIPVRWSIASVKLTSGGRPLSFKQTDEGIAIELYDGVLGSCPLALAFTISGCFPPD
jgi:alpha-L-fucosidase